MFRNHKSFSSYKGKPQFDGSSNQLNSKAIEELQKCTIQALLFFRNMLTLVIMQKEATALFSAGLVYISCVKCTHIAMNYKLSPGRVDFARSKKHQAIRILLVCKTQINDHMMPSFHKFHWLLSYSPVWC